MPQRAGMAQWAGGGEEPCLPCSGEESCGKVLGKSILAVVRKDWLLGQNRKMRCEANVLLCTNWTVRWEVFKGICTLLPEFLEVLEALFSFLN